VGNDMVSGGAGNDYLGGELGDDTVIGGAGNDYLFGDEGNDIVQGGDGYDYLQGYTGNDLLDGGIGDDLLAGGTGADVLAGGAGSDTFLYYDAADSTPSAADQITDFSADDQLDLSLVDADIAAADDQAFAGLGNAPAAHSLWFTSTGSNADGSVDLTIYGDVNGDTVADFAVNLHATAGFSADNITL
jgi:Ca2+-binding RTX toxin-like protein